jgi:hypothetical protein
VTMVDALTGSVAAANPPTSAVVTKPRRSSADRGRRLSRSSVHCGVTDGNERDQHLVATHEPGNERRVVAGDDRAVAGQRTAGPCRRAAPADPARARGSSLRSSDPE